MRFKNESFDIAIWMETMKQNTKKIYKKLGSELWQDQLVFMWTTSDCKPQKGYKAIDNPTKCIYTKSLKNVWEMHTQYDATNNVSGLFTWES